MIARLRKSLYLKLLPGLLTKKCPSEIPRSGEDGKKINCFSVAIDNNSEPDFLLREYSTKEFSVLKWNGERYADRETRPISEVLNGGLRVTHFYGLNTITFYGIWSLALHRFTGLIYLRVFLGRFFNELGTLRFKRKKLITKKRMELLQFLVEAHIGAADKGMDSFEIMTRLYSMRWVIHPESDIQYEKLKLYLNALEQNGDLSKVNGKYLVQGKAINTLDRYEEDERRHSEVVRTQRLIALLTFAIALFAMVQAEVIKLPTFIDLSNELPFQEGKHNNAFNSEAGKAGAG
jgi:hypothetical protein